jgi:hypothetical protein
MVILKATRLLEEHRRDTRESSSITKKENPNSEKNVLFFFFLFPFSRQKTGTLHAKKKQYLPGKKPLIRIRRNKNPQA